MDALRFADLARAFVTTGTRRATLGLGAAGLLGVLGLDDADAKRKKGKNKNKNKKKCKKCGACQACKKGKCKPAAAGTPCGEGQQCFADGTCHACDVCLGDCDFTSLRDAVAFASPDATIQICPGRYPTNVEIKTNLTVVGAGSGAGGTILDGQRRGRVIDVGLFVAATMRGLTITGGSSTSGAGIFAQFTEITLEDVHLTDNHSSVRGGAILSDRSTVILSNSRVTDNSAADGGGIYNGNNSDLELKDNSVVTGNTAPDSGGGNDGQGAGGIRNAGETVVISEDSSVTGNKPVDCLGTPAC